jgi:2-iminobutanoate/2-iminopropanoate deaminase
VRSDCDQMPMNGTTDDRSMGWAKRAVRVPELFDSRPYGFEHCVVAGPLVFVAGQTAWDPVTRSISLDFEPQVRGTFEKIRTALASAGAELKDLVSMTVFLTDARYSDEFRKLRIEIMGVHFATSALITVAQLGQPAELIEIQATAVRRVG